MSSGLENENQAMQIANSYEKATVAASQNRLTEATARRILREIQMLAGIEAPDAESIRSFLERRRIALRARFRSGRTLERYEGVLNRFLEGHPELADRPLPDLTRRAAVDWRDRLLAEALSASTVNHHLSTLAREFREAKLQDLILENPWEGVRAPNARRHAQKRQAFTWQQFLALLDTTGPKARDPINDAAEWHLFIKIAGYMGQRRMDVALLRADQVDERKRVVRFRRAKNKDWLEVPVHSALWPDLVAAKRQHRDGYLLPQLAKRPATGRNSLSDEFRQVVLPRIGIDQPYGRGEGRKLADYSIHSLRHALSTWLNDAGVSDVDRMRIVGHASQDVSRNYTHAGLKQAKRAIERLPKINRLVGSRGR